MLQRFFIGTRWQICSVIALLQGKGRGAASHPASSDSSTAAHSQQNSLSSLSAVLSPSPRLLSQLAKQGLVSASTSNLHAAVDGGFTPLSHRSAATPGQQVPPVNRDAPLQRASAAWLGSSYAAK